MWNAERKKFAVNVASSFTFYRLHILKLYPEYESRKVAWDPRTE